MESYNGFYKVNEDNGGVCMCKFYNPTTKETFSEITWDIDRPYINYDERVEILRYMPINEEIRHQYLHERGVIQIGDSVEVVKGRKVPIGTVAKVVAIKPFYDRYGRWQCNYLYFDNGMRTNTDNCILI